MILFSLTYSLSHYFSCEDDGPLYVALELVHVVIFSLLYSLVDR
jgi:hypothetical protein